MRSGWSERANFRTSSIGMSARVPIRRVDSCRCAVRYSTERLLIDRSCAASSWLTSNLSIGATATDAGAFRFRPFVLGIVQSFLELINSEIAPKFQKRPRPFSSRVMLGRHQLGIFRWLPELNGASRPAKNAISETLYFRCCNQLQVSGSATGKTLVLIGWWNDEWNC